MSIKGFVDLDGCCRDADELAVFLFAVDLDEDRVLFAFLGGFFGGSLRSLEGVRSSLRGVI
jgi:hypothetical protein